MDYYFPLLWTLIAEMYCVWQIMPSEVRQKNFFSLKNCILELKLSKILKK